MLWSDLEMYEYSRFLCLLQVNHKILSQWRWMKAYYLITSGFVSEKYLGESLFQCGILIVDVYINCDRFLGPFGFLQMDNG